MMQTYDCPCNTCAWAEWDYDEYYGGGKLWFMSECEKGYDPPIDDECEGYFEYVERERDEW